MYIHNDNGLVTQNCSFFCFGLAICTLITALFTTLPNKNTQSFI